MTPIAERVARRFTAEAVRGDRSRVVVILSDGGHVTRADVRSLVLKVAGADAAGTDR